MKGLLFWEDPNNLCGPQRQKIASDLIALFCCCMTYNLEASSCMAETGVHSLLDIEHFTMDLFTVPILKTLLPFVTYRKSSEDPLQMLPAPGTNLIAFFDDLVASHVIGYCVSQEFIDRENGGWCITPSMANDPMFALLLHSCLQQSALKSEIEQFSDESKERNVRDAVLELVTVDGDTGDGVSTNYIVARLSRRGFRASDVQSAILHLVETDGIFSTSDEDHYMAT